MIIWFYHLTSPILFALCCALGRSTLLPLVPILSQGSHFLPRLPARHCPLFLHGAAPAGFGAADFPFAHRCPGKCCDTVVFSGHPKNMSQKSPSPSLYFYTHPHTSCSFVKLINQYYVRPKYTQASFKALVLEGI